MANTSLKFGNGNWAIKEDSALAYSDQYDNFKPLPFDFSRAGSGTIVNKEGLIESVNSGLPRIDFSDSADGALLLEPQRTNLVSYSEDFSNGTWSKTGLTVSSNQIISPDGSLNADEINITSANAHFLFKFISVNASTNYVLTFYAKKGTATDVSYSIYDSTNSADIIASTSYYSQISNTNWTRITVEFTTPSGCTSVRPYPLRDGSSTGTVYIWGAQLEEQSYPTSYIPTQGSTSTRIAETCKNSGSAQDFNSEEGVLYAEISALANDGTERNLSLSDGTSGNRISWWFTATDTLAVAVYSGGVLQYFTNLSVGVATNFNKIVFKYKENDFAFWVNGFKLSTDTSGITPLGLSELSFHRGDDALPFYGKTKNIQVFTEALSDEKLEYITSYRSLNELVTALKLNTL